jgi:pimeloyl-ACP methyl ester carboxylesterase
LPEEISLQLEDLRVGGLRWGADNPQKILAVHGWLDNAASFYFLAPLLAARGYELVAIDLPGHGNSQHRPKGSSYHLVDYLREMHQVLDVLQWPHPVLLGHSLGGIIASMLCAAAPDRVQKLVMLESVGPITSDPADLPGNLQSALTRVLKQNSVKRVYRSIDAAVTDRQKGFGKISKAASHVLVSRNLMPAEDGWVWKTDSRLRWPSFIRFTEPQVAAYLSSLTLPVLLIAATQGYISLDHNKNPRLAYLNNARTEWAEGGHHFHMDGDVDKIAKVIAGFSAPGY